MVRVTGGRIAVFLDRDGTVTHPRHYPSRPSDLVLYEDIVPPLRALQRHGVLLIMVTNQSGLARGYFSLHDFRAMRASLDHELRRRGVTLDAVYFCPHHPDGSVPELAVACGCRKPRPGMLLRAAREHGIDLPRSWMIGDFASDVEAGRRAGCHTVWVRHDAGVGDPPAAPSVETTAGRAVEHVVTNTADALRHALASLPAPAAETRSTDAIDAA